LLKLLPYFAMWFLLTAVYLIMPNEKVPVRSGVLGAVVAGTLFQIVQWVYIKFQIGVASQSAIYGSFAALPLFLGWLQISWMIVLFGAEIAHASEHHETFGFHPDYARVGTASKKLLVLRIFHLLVKKFAAGEKPLTMREIAHTLKIPVSLVRVILSELTATGLVVEIAKGIRRDLSFQPGRDIEDITIKKVLDAYEKRGDTDVALTLTQSDEAEKLSLYMRMISEAIEQSPGNVKLKDI
jgi:membrane protein